MEPYFYNLENHLFSIDERKVIETTFRDNIQKFTAYIDFRGDIDDNNILKHRELSSNKSISRILSSLNIRPRSIIGLMHKPNTILKRHIDDTRHGVIICPIYPLPGHYTSTDFYKLYSDNNYTCSCIFPDNIPAIINTQEIHSVNNINDYRFNLQFCFNEDFSYLVQQYKQGKLFK
jgi:hypothetical protein